MRIDIKSKKAVSLMVLMITIVVMTIIASVVIISLSNAGIIDKAEQAVTETNLANVKDLAKLGWANAYGEGARTVEALTAGVNAMLESHNINIDLYNIIVTKGGVKVSAKGPWKQEGLTVTNGTLTLQIGDDIAYDESNGGTITGIDNLSWQVLGVSDRGELLIISKKSTGYLEFGSDTDLKKAQNDWLNAPKMLDELCEPYAKGKGAIGARNVNMDDYAMALNVDFETNNDEGTYSNTDTVTYYYDGTEMSYKSTDGSDDIMDIDTIPNKFHYYNGNDFVEVDLTKTTGEIATIKNNNYGIDSDTLETIDKTSKAFNMMFNWHYGDYWLSCSEILAGGAKVSYSLVKTEDMFLTAYDLWSCWGPESQNWGGARPVIILSPDIQLTGSSASGWSII